MLPYFQDEEGKLSEYVECWSQRESGQCPGEETVSWTMTLCIYLVSYICQVLLVFNSVNYSGYVGIVVYQY